MAIIAGVTVKWRLSPRIIIIPTSEIQITLEDLQDTLQDLEDDVDGMVFPHLREMSGGEDLGGGTTVGFTMELQNAQVMWATNNVSLESGTITTPDTSGITITDSAATFVTNGVSAGDMVVNEADGSHATILDVVSETELTTDGLSGGTDDQFDSADAYQVFDWQERNIAGGNLVAIDDVGSTIDPALPSFGNFVVRTSSSSATLQDLELTNIQYLIESLRDDHQGFGEIFFVDPVLGDDNNSGTTDLTPVMSIQYAHDTLCVSGRNDVINVINKSGATSATIADTTITKNEIHIRGAGRSISIEGSASAGTMFTIDGDNCSIDGLLIDGANLSNYCIVINGRHFKMIKPWIKQALLDNVLIRGGDYHEFISMENEKAGGAGLATFDAELSSGSPREITVSGESNIYLNGDNGIRLDSVLLNPAGTSTRLVRIRGNTHLFDNTGYGIEITGNVSGTAISEEVNIYSNSSGEVLDGGLNTVDFRIQTKLSNITALAAAGL